MDRRKEEWRFRFGIYGENGVRGPGENTVPLKEDVERAMTKNVTSEDKVIKVEVVDLTKDLEKQFIW